jgi:hypothetical protein
MSRPYGKSPIAGSQVKGTVTRRCSVTRAPKHGSRAHNGWSHLARTGGIWESGEAAHLKQEADVRLASLNTGNDPDETADPVLKYDIPIVCGAFFQDTFCML